MISVISQRILKYSMCEFLHLQRRIVKTRPSEYYFAYGANLSVERLKKNQIQYQKIGLAKLSDWQIEFTMPCEYMRKGFASLSRRPNTETWGILLKVSRPSLLMFDILEWVPFGSYRRILVPVTVGKKRYEKVWVYVARNPRKGLKPSNEYLDKILMEAKRLKFPESYLKFLSQFEGRDRFDLDPGFSLLVQSQRRPFEQKLREVYLFHDRLREFVAERLP